MSCVIFGQKCYKNSRKLTEIIENLQRNVNISTFMENVYALHKGWEVSNSECIIEPCNRWGPGSQTALPVGAATVWGKLEMLAGLIDLL